MATAHYTPVRTGAEQTRASLLQYFRKIQEAAHDGRQGSDAYARDRLALIQAIATSAIQIHELDI